MAAQADVTAGFFGEVSTADLPDMLGRGARYVVGGANDLKVTAGGAGDRSVTVAAGMSWADAVKAVWDEDTVLNAAANSSGTTRWDTLVRRTDWAAETATLTLLTGGVSQALAPGVQLRNPTPTTGAGFTYSDQPLALVPVANLAATVVNANIIPLRIWSGEGGILVAEHSKARDYITSVGTGVWIDESLHVRALDGTGTAQWYTYDLTGLGAVLRNSSGTQISLTPSGTTGSGPEFHVTTNGGGHFYGRVNGATVWRFDATGRLAVGSVPAASVTGTPAGIRYGGTDKNIPNSTTPAGTIYDFPSGSFSYDGGVTGQSGGLVAPIAGWYTITANMRWRANGTGVRSVMIYVGSTKVADEERVASGSASAAASASALVKLDEGDVVYMRVAQTSGATLASIIEGSVPRLSMAWVGA